PSTHPIRGDELRELRKLRKASTGPFVFMSERGGPFTTDSFNWMVKRAGQKAKLPFQVHAHMLRHSAGYKLAGDGHDTRSSQDYLGHRDIRHTARYTELSAKPCLAMYYREPTESASRELDLAAAMTRTAAAIILRPCNS